MKLSVIDGCAVPTSIADEVREIKRLSGATLVSCYRGDDAAALLHRLGKWTQRDAWNAFISGRGNPANRPGQSTHECRNDGVAYKGPVGKKLPEWCVGMDWDIPHVQAVVRAAAKKKWIATVTYPHSARERQHVNFRKRPVLNIFRSLKLGSKGKRVELVTRRLMVARDPDTHKPYLTEPARTYTARVQAAVKSFQFDHGGKVDGIVGPQTWAQIEVSHRWWYRHNKEKK